MKGNYSSSYLPLTHFQDESRSKAESYTGYQGMLVVFLLYMAFIVYQNISAGSKVTTKWLNIQYSTEEITLHFKKYTLFIIYAHVTVHKSSDLNGSIFIDGK